MHRLNPEGPYLLDPDNEQFPDPEDAMEEPNGLLAVGGDLSPGRLLSAYRSGVFPWFNPGEPILWWSPNPRAVVEPAQIHISRSLAKRMRKGEITTSFDRAFDQVIQACAEYRPGSGGTWITAEMQAAYLRLHRLGYAHSVESWADGQLVGGLYGISLGGAFYGESMFSRQTDCSKIAYVRLAQQLKTWGFGLIDAQLMSDHMASLGAKPIPRREFLTRNRELITQQDRLGPWVYSGEQPYE